MPQSRNTMQKTYYFNRRDYDSNGYNNDTGEFFHQKIHEWENDFSEIFLLEFANHVFANDSTMILLKDCFYSDPNEDFGMDLFNDDISIDINLSIESYSTRTTNYALGSEVKGNIDEPLYLLIDSKMADGIITLKYLHKPSIFNL
jgi:hypothetical protein